MHPTNSTRTLSPWPVSVRDVCPSPRRRFSADDIVVRVGCACASIACTGWAVFLAHFTCPAEPVALCARRLLCCLKRGSRVGGGRAYCSRRRPHEIGRRRMRRRLTTASATVARVSARHTTMRIGGVLGGGGFASESLRAPAADSAVCDLAVASVEAAGTAHCSGHTTSVVAACADD